MDVSHLKTNVTVGEHRGAFFDHSRKEIEAAGEAGHVNSHSSSIKYIDNKWMRCAFTFSALGLDEGLDTSEDCVSRGIEISGRITVSVQRGGAKSLPTPKLRSAAKWTSETSSTSSKDILKSGLVSHTTNLVPLKQIAPPPIAKAFEVASGSTGKRIAFIFRARSAACLRLLKIVDLDEDEAPTAQDASTNTMSSMPAGPVTKSPKTVFPAVKIEEAVTKKEELQDTRTLSIKRGHAVAFDEDDITIMSSRRAPNMQTSRQSVRNAASVRQSKLTEADRERKKAHLQLRRKEMDLERQELALRKRELAIEREELDLA